MMTLQEQHELAHWQQLPRHERFALPEEHTWTTRIGVCFRVVALDGARPNYVALAARSPNAQRTSATLRKHLKWSHECPNAIVLSVLELVIPFAKS